MTKNFKILVVFIVMCAILFCLTGCNQANNVQYNISKKSDSFDTYRKVTVINLRSDKVLMEVEGLIAIKDSSEDELTIIIKTGDEQYKMHYVYFGGEVVYLVEQIENSTTNPYHWDIHIFAERPDIVVD